MLLSQPQRAYSFKTLVSEAIEAVGDIYAEEAQLELFLSHLLLVSSLAVGKNSL